MDQQPTQSHSYAQRHSLPRIPSSSSTSSDPQNLRRQQYSARIQALRRLNSDDVTGHESTGHGAQLPPLAFGSQTWMDFLRDDVAEGLRSDNSGANNFGNTPRTPQATGLRPAYNPTLGMQRTNSDGSERKRRLTAPESPDRRGGPARPSSYRYSHAAAPGPSNISTVDVTSSPPQMHSFGMPASTQSNSGSRPLRRSFVHQSQIDTRRPSDIIVPPWQPDSEALICPVCHTQFSWYFRKHHCRKCGRVVCDNCSPHRITLPRQFIVQPPSPTAGAGMNIIDLTDDLDAATYFLNNLGGGEKVRVCNPCVPDPNLSPPQPQQNPQEPSSGLTTFPRIDTEDPPQHMGQRVSTPATTHSRATSNHPASRPPNHRFSHSDVFNSYGSVRPSQLPPLGAFPTSLPNASHAYSRMPESRYSQPLPSLPGSSHAYGHRPSVDVNAPLPPTPARPPPPTPPPRRQIAEEDECPVCGLELPPKGPDGSEVNREAHVMECINSSYAPSSSTPTNRASMPHPSAAMDAAVAASARTPSQAISAYPQSLPSGSSGSLIPGRERAESSVRARRNTGARMLVYKATEKDAVGDDGLPQECVICFEEFEEGEEMGRLECLCKFHRGCIRKWWETKGSGSCPTHQLHD